MVQKQSKTVVQNKGGGEGSASDNQNSYLAQDVIASRIPPVQSRGLWRWMRDNLFSSPKNIALTLFSAVLVYWLGQGIFTLFVEHSLWQGGIEACQAEKTSLCFSSVWARMKLYAYGDYAITGQTWRVNIVGVLFLVSLLWMIFKRPGTRWVILFMLTLYPVIAFLVLRSTPWLEQTIGLKVVPTNSWGGFMLTMVIAVVAIIFSLPLGVLLALGRRSSLPAIRIFSIVFIEFWRGIPLVAILFIAKYLLPVLLGLGTVVADLALSLVAITCFASAYLAEVVRGGLQVIPKGQYEGAQSLGLKYGQNMRFIVLPQALTIVIPGIVSIFIGLFKETTLVSIVGLVDFLAQVDRAAESPTWGLIPTVHKTGYFFTAAVYFIFCFAMSRYAAHLEKRLITDRRH